MNEKALLIFSVTLFAVSLFFFRKTNLKRINRTFFSLLVFSSICLNLAYFASDYFTANGIDDSVLYHIQYGLAGAGFSDYWGLISFSAFCIIIALALSFWIIAAKSKNKRRYNKYVYAAFIPALMSLLISPATMDLYDLFLSQSIVSTADGDFYKYYTKPYIKRVGKNKNLVFIYAESLEQTFFDNELFPGLIKELRDNEFKTTYFTNINQVGGGEWTMGGVVSSQCGIPLVTPSHGNSMAGMDKFLPSAVCLGDLLKEEDYYLSYYGGASLWFAGKGKFYTTHKFDEVKGSDDLLPMQRIPEYKSSWGVFDDVLFAMIYQRFLELSANRKRFALFTLTLDTHPPNGSPSPFGCRDIVYGTDPMLNAVACSDHLIADFIKKIFQSPYGSNTVVVVVSDTLSMRNSALDLLQQGDRKNLFMVIESGKKEKKIIDELGSTLDTGSTILPFIGYKGEVGLGRDLTSEKSEFKEISSLVKSWRPHFSKFWDFPKVQNYIDIDLSKATIDIDGRTFKAPVLIELNEDLESTIFFDFNKTGDQKSLVDQVQLFDKNKAFLLIDACTDVSRFHKSFGRYGGCIVGGKYGKYWNIARIIQPNADALFKGEQVYRLNPDDIRYFLGISTPLEFQAKRIAHAGGGISGKSHTNSYEALNENIKKGFDYFELDFSFTSDEHLVCIYDWEDSFERSFGFKSMERPTLEVFSSLVKNKSEFQKCTLDGLVDWMEQNPSAKIVTDVKDDNLKALELIAKTIPNSMSRIIPQIYNPSNYDLVKKMGYKQIIWTLYRFNGSNKEVLEWVDRFNMSFAVTMPKGRALTNLPRELAKKHIPTYVHTINSPEEMNKFFYEFSIGNIYTDFLNP